VRSILGPLLAATFTACGTTSAPGALLDAGVHEGGPLDGSAVRDTTVGDVDAHACSILGAADAAFEASAPPHGDRLLFIGDSFTSVNDLPGTLLSMVKEWAPSATPPFVDSYTVGGETLAEDLTQVNDAGTDASLRLLLVGGGGAGRAHWTDVVLQEQSEIPGFPLCANPERQASIAAAVALSKDAVASGATPTLYMTWGYRDGDSVNPTLYPNFLTMEGLLEIGYRAMGQAIAHAGYRVLIAPVGPAFKAVYDADIRAGRKPTAATSIFFSLYESDGKHPAPPATYLAALVILSTLYGVDPGAVCANPEALASDVQKTLVEAARTAVVEERAYDAADDFGVDAGDNCPCCPACGSGAPACCHVAPCPP
jgi:hypothetical protein